MQISGMIKEIHDQQQFGDKFVKRTFVIVTEEKYPQSISVELHGPQVDLINNYKVGQDVDCQINLRGRAWENPQGEVKYFNTIVCWKIELIKNGFDNDEPEILF